MDVSTNTENFLWSVKNQNKNEILELLQKKDVDSKETSESGDTALHLIFQNENLTEKDVVELLKTFLVQGVDPRARNKNKITVLHLAIVTRWRDVIDLLISRNADILTRDKKSDSIAHFFVKYEERKFNKFFEFEDGQFRMLDKEMEQMEFESASFAEWLISKGCDFDYSNETGRSALHLSITEKLHHITLVLLKHTQNIRYVGDFSKTLLHLFMEYNFYGKIEERDDELVKVRYSAYSLRYADRIVKLLIERGLSATDADRLGRTSLQAAIYFKEDTSIVDLLIQQLLKSCPQNSLIANVLTELFKGVAHWGESQTDYFLATSLALVEQGANVNAKIVKYRDTISLLYSAFNAENRRAIDFLDNNGADFNAITANGENLFHALAKSKSEDRYETLDELFEFLMGKHCCDINAKDENGDTPLHSACRRDNLPILRKLIDYGAVVDCTNKDRQTPLHLTVDFNFDEHEEAILAIVEYLVRNGADINAKDRFGDRPLIYAAFYEIEKSVSMCLKLGAYVNVYSNGDSPFSTAIELGSKKNVKEMLAYGGDINNPRVIDLVRSSKPVSMQILLSHCIKLKTARLACADDYEDFIENVEYEKLKQDCLLELEKLKKTLIDSHTSVYNFLHMDFDSRRIHINNGKLKNLVDSSDLEERFPLYFVLILASYRQTVAWRKLLEPAKQAWRELTNTDFLEDCIDRIFGYLRVEDLVTMIEHRDEPVCEGSTLPYQIDMNGLRRDKRDHLLHYKIFR